MDEITKKNIGERLSDLRKEKGFTQLEVAEKTGIQRTTINYYECGARKVKVEDLLTLSAFYKVSTDYLLCNSDIKTTDKNVKLTCETTGLSEDAIHYIMNADKSELRALNAFFQSQDLFNDFISASDKYCLEEVFNYVLKDFLLHDFFDEFKSELKLKPNVDLQKELKERREHIFLYSKLWLNDDTVNGFEAKMKFERYQNQKGYSFFDNDYKLFKMYEKVKNILSTMINEYIENEPVYAKIKQYCTRYYEFEESVERIYFQEMNDLQEVLDNKSEITDFKTLVEHFNKPHRTT
mgnify:CR=1 FL=1